MEWFIMENHIEMEDLGVPLSLETPIFWIHLMIPWISDSPGYKSGGIHDSARSLLGGSSPGRNVSGLLAPKKRPFRRGPTLPYVLGTCDHHGDLSPTTYKSWDDSPSFLEKSGGFASQVAAMRSKLRDRIFVEGTTGSNNNEGNMTLFWLRPNNTSFKNHCKYQ